MIARKYNPLLTSLFGCCVLACTPSTFAATSYVGASVMHLEEDGGGAALSAAYGRFGAHIDQYTSLEWRLGTGVMDDSLTSANQSETDIDLDLMYGVYLRGGIPLAQFYPYVGVGYTKMEFDISSIDGSRRDRASDISFAVGLDYVFTPSLRATAEYQQYINDAPLRVYGVSLGLSFSY